jgi:RHS repeat-associated protein
MYYDIADRKTADINVGTNAGNSYTRPNTLNDTLNNRSDVLLRTDYGYLADNLQKVGVTASGTFTLTFNGQTTNPALQTSATAAQVQSALQALSSIGTNNALVTGPDGGPWLVRFTGSKGESFQNDMTGSGSTGVTVTLSTLVAGADSGRNQKLTDPRALVAKTDFDLLGQSIATVQAFNNLSTAPTNSNQTTEMTYDGAGHMLTLKADLVGSGTNNFQTTQYVYGYSSSVISSNDLLATIKYPDKTSGQPSSFPADQESFTYNALGGTTRKTDRNGNVHGFTFDVLGRTSADTINTFGTGVDQTIKRLGTAFDGAGRPITYTSYSDTGGNTVVNQVQQTYNGLGQVITQAQEHAGAVTGNSLNVQYSYSFDPNGTSNHSRLVSMTYPNARQLTYNYNSADGLDSAVSRLTSISDSAGTIEQYLYLGLGTVVQRTHPKLGAPGVNIGLSYIQQAGDPTCTPGQPGCDAGDKYIGLDRFGRVVDQRWISSDAVNSPLDRFLYGYDRDSNRLYRNNVVNTAFGELYHASGAGNGYDVLNQMTDFARGSLSSSNPPNGPLDTIATPSITKNWNLDIVGNWNALCSNGTGTNCTGGTLQARTHNKQNEVIQIGSAALQFDNNGKTTQDETGKTLKFDAWNRLVSVNPGATPLASYTFDALGRRIQETHSSTTTDLYFSQSWQVLEEDQGGLWNAQYIWSPVYIDALIERDTITRVSTSRLYVEQDANSNVTSISDSSGSVQEREVYDPYGAVTFYNNLWQNPSSQSSFSWVYLHQGGRSDSTTGFYNFRNREYSPSLGRWFQLDPIANWNSERNSYLAMGNNPPKFLDPFGTITITKDHGIAWLPEGFKWMVDFKADPQEIPGFFIQRVIQMWEIRDDKGRLLDASRKNTGPVTDARLPAPTKAEPYVFWEAWNIEPNGNISIFKPGWKRTIFALEPNAGSDTFGFTDARKCTKGYFFVAGEMFHDAGKKVPGPFHRDLTAFVPTGGWGGWEHGYRGTPEMPATRSMPQGLTSTGFSRMVYFQWDYTKENGPPPIRIPAIWQGHSLWPTLPDSMRWPT